jgi:BlaI family transcriptional regulator, penicillinase repressor
MTAPVPSDRELELLKILWELGEASVRDVHAALNKKRRSAFNTVQTQLRNMEEKGLVEHSALGRSFIYRPLYSRQQVSSRFLDQVFDGAIDQLMLSMLQATNVSEKELDELAQMIAETRRQSSSRKSKKKK